jgi:hypothetical protein
MIEKKWLTVNSNTLELSLFVKEILLMAPLILSRNSKVVFFYQNKTNDQFIPFALQIAYELIDKKQKSQVLLMPGNLSKKSRELYMACSLNGSYFPNHLFGMGIVKKNGDIRSERISFGKTRFKYNVENKILFSSSFSICPSNTGKIKAAIVLSPAIWNFYRLEDFNDWIDRSQIDCLICFDNYPSSKKIQRYKKMGFFVYGWSRSEINSQLPKQFKNNPFSNISELQLFIENPSFSKSIITDYACDRHFKKIFSDLSCARKDELLGSEQVLVEARSILREIQAIPTSLSSFSSMQKVSKPFLPSLINRTEMFCSLLESFSEEKGRGRMKDISDELKQLLAHLKESNPKFYAIKKEVERMFSLKGKKALICRNWVEKKALENEFKQAKSPITENDFSDYETNILTMKEIVSPPKIRFSAITLTTYPYHNKAWILSKKLSSAAAICLHPLEDSDFKFFEKLYKQLESKYFNPQIREAIRRFYTEKKLFELPQLEYVEREIGQIEQKEQKKEKRSSDVLTLLSKLEDFFSGTPVSDFSHSISDGISHETAMADCIEFYFTDGNKLIVPNGRIMQALSETDEILYIKASELKIGQTVLVINRNAQSDLNELIFEKAGEFPLIAWIQKYSSRWRESLINGMEGEKDNETTLLQKLRQMDCKRESEFTIKGWRDGLVIGPRDYQDIKRISKVYKDKDLEENFENVVTSIKRLKSLRREIITRTRNAMLDERSEELEKLGINPEEFQNAFDNAIEFFRIKDIKKRKSVPRNLIGKVVKNYAI